MKLIQQQMGRGTVFGNGIYDPENIKDREDREV